MATNKYINARLQQKHDIEANWITAGNNGFIPLAGEIIIYDIDDKYNYYRLKIGDGITNINELIFTNTADQIDWDAVGVPYHISEKIIPEQTLELKPNFLLEFYGNTTQAIERLIIGETYLVNWEGKEYLCIAQEVPQEHGYDNAVYIGNSIITNGGILDTLPFVIGTSEAGYNAFVIDLELNKTAVTFSCTKERIKTIDPLCLNFDWIPNFGMLNKGKEILSETTVTKSSLYGTFMFTSSAPYYFKNKQAYLIEWNHKPYAAIYNFISDESSSPTNSYGQFSTEDFTILSWFDPSEAEGARNRLDCFDKKNNLSEVTLAIYELDAENKLPNSFLDLDWKPISEKYDRLINNSVVYSFTLHHDDIYYGDVLYSVKIKKNTSYKVKWEDQFYEVIGKEVEYDGSTCIGLGNFSLLNSDDEDTNEPFLIIFTAGPYSVNKLFTRSNAQRAVSIYDNEIVYNKIPKEFLPDGYPYISESIILPETSFEVVCEDGISYGQGMIVDKFVLEKDCEYEVTWNGTTYNCIGTEVESSGISLVALGDIEKDPNTDSLNYPFGIINANDEIATAMGVYGIIFVYDNSAEVTLSINGSTIHKIDSRFIPDLGVVTNIVNGDNIGSTRSISASQNDDEYQIGPFATAVGLETKASGDASHAEGSHTTASGDGSHAEGYWTTVSGDYSHVQGKYNVEGDNEQYAHIVGNGEYNSRSNAHTLDWSGNAWFSGDVYVGSTSGINKDEGSKKLATEEYVSNAVATKSQVQFITWEADD